MTDPKIVAEANYLKVTTHLQLFTSPNVDGIVVVGPPGEMDDYERKLVDNAVRNGVPYSRPEGTRLLLGDKSWVSHWLFFTDALAVDGPLTDPLTGLEYVQPVLKPTTKTIVARLFWGKDTAITVPIDATTDQIVLAIADAGNPSCWIAGDSAVLVINGVSGIDVIRSKRIAGIKEERYVPAVYSDAHVEAVKKAYGFTPVPAPTRTWWNSNTGVQVTLPETASKEEIRDAVVAAGLSRYPSWNVPGNNVWRVFGTDNKPGKELVFSASDFNVAKGKTL